MQTHATVGGRIGHQNGTIVFFSLLLILGQAEIAHVFIVNAMQRQDD